MLDLQFLQFFGSDMPSTPAEQLNAVSFNESYMVTGDSSGRLVVFKKVQSKANSKAKYKPFLQKQVHYDEFDSVRGQPISSKINSVKFLPFGDFLLSANERDIILSKVEARGDLVCRRRFNNLETMKIRSLDVNCDRFIASDGYTIKEYWVENHHYSQLLYDEGLGAVRQSDTDSFQPVDTYITASKYLKQDHLLMFSASDGKIVLKDQRETMRGKQLTIATPSAVDDFQVHKNEVYARSTNCVQVYDVRNTRGPLLTIPLSPKYKYNSKTEQKFKIALVQHPRCWISGYFGQFLQIGSAGGDVMQFKATRNVAPDLPGLKQLKAVQVVRKAEPIMENYQMNDFQGSCTVCEVSEANNVLAVGSGANLLLYSLK